MTNKVTLDSIRKAADAKYGTYDIELDDETTVSFTNMLRVNKDVRATFQSMSSALAEEDADTFQVLTETLRGATTTPAAFDKLIEALDNDLAELFVVFEQYSGATQLGEASASDS